MEAQMTARDGHSSLGPQLERRLSEAWQGLWDNFVDPREPLWDDGPAGWQPARRPPPRSGTRRQQDDESRRYA